MPSSVSRFGANSCAVLLCAALSTSSLTQADDRADEPARPASEALSAPQRPSLDDNYGRSTEQRDGQELRERSLRGPSIEVVSGGILTLAAPVVGTLLAFSQGTELFPCGGLLGGETDPECEAAARRQNAHARRLSLGVSVPLALVGLGLVGHGAYRIRQVRVARRQLSLAPPSVALDRHGAHVSLGVAF